MRKSTLGYPWLMHEILFYNTFSGEKVDFSTNGLLFSVELSAFWGVTSRRGPGEPGIDRRGLYIGIFTLGEGGVIHVRSDFL